MSLCRMGSEGLVVIGEVNVLVVGTTGLLEEGLESVFSGNGSIAIVLPLSWTGTVITGSGAGAGAEIRGH